MESSCLPCLPDEAIRHIMAFMDPKTLLSFRLSSVKWNKAACCQLRRSLDATVRFQYTDSGILQKYVEIFQSRVQDEIPYANYRITIGEVLPVCSFLDVIGPYITSCTLDINASPSKVKLNLLLKNFPNMEILHVHATTLEQDTMDPPLPGQLNCSKLKNFRIKVYRETSVGYEDGILEGWIGNMPALQILDWEICIIFPSQSRFLEFISSKQHYCSISLKVRFEQEVLFYPEGLQNLPPNMNMKLNIEVLNLNGKFSSNFVSNVKDVLSKLTVVVKEGGDNFLLPEVPNLEGLSIRPNAIIKVAQFWSKNLPELFPALKHVSLDFFNRNRSLDADIRPHFQRLRFCTVESLQVNCGFELDGSPYRPYHIIFPNITSFTIKGLIVNAGHVAYIRNFLQQIVQLTIVSSSAQDSESDLKDSLFFEESSKGKCAWALSTLKGLKKLHIQDLHPQNLKAIILGMAALTHLEIVPPLELLSFHGQTDGFEKLLFTKCTFHRYVQFLDDNTPPGLDRIKTLGCVRNRFYFKKP